MAQAEADARGATDNNVPRWMGMWCAYAIAHADNTDDESVVEASFPLQDVSYRAKIIADEAETEAGICAFSTALRQRAERIESIYACIKDIVWHAHLRDLEERRAQGSLLYQTFEV